MKKNHSQEQILKILQEGERGIKVEDLARKHNIGKSTYHKWKARFSGMTISDATRLKSLEQENTQLS